jgi:hypothetical protein
MPIASTLLILALASLTEALNFLRHVANHILLVEEVYGTVLKPSSIPRFGNSPASSGDLTNLELVVVNPNSSLSCEKQLLSPC